MALILLGTGCVPEQLGQCDENLAKTVVFNSSGLPAFAGQAMVEEACSGCHSQTAMGALRRGAPAELDFDMVGNRGGAGADAAVRLANARDVIFEWRSEMFTTVEDGSMPPGEVGQAAYLSAGYTYESGTPLEAIESANGSEVYRNWLACGGPVVATVGETGTPGDSCGEDEAGDCIVRRGAEPCVPTWTNVYEKYFSGCLGCHTTGNSFVEMSNLDMATSEIAYAAFLDSTALGPMCGGGPARVIPMDADGSMLVQKLENTQVDCGVMMPIGPALPQDQIDCVREWIDAGAMDN